MKVTIKPLLPDKQPFLYRGRGLIFFLHPLLNSQVVILQRLRATQAPLVDLVVKGPNRALNEKTLDHRALSLVNLFTNCNTPVNHVYLFKPEKYYHHPLEHYNFLTAISVAVLAFYDHTL